MRVYALCFLASLAGCSSSEPPSQPRPAQPADESRYLPTAGRVATHVVADHLLDPAIPPGGTIGEYKDANGSYELGLIHMPSNDKAAFLLLDVKKAIAQPQYLPNMGGFFGLDRSVPLYVFAKGPYVAMVRGLTQEQADPIARTFAARIPYP